MSKKVNIKKFLLSINENIILEKLFHSSDCEDVPFLSKDINKKDKENLLMGYYKSLEADKRLEVLEKVKIINAIANKSGAKVIKEYLDKNNYKPLDVTAETVTEKAVAFYFEHEEKWGDVASVCNALSTSGYRRFESVEKNIFNTEEKDINFKNAVTEHIENVYEGKDLEVKTNNFAGDFYTEISFTENKEKRNIYIVYIPKSKMLLLKLSGSKDEQYYFADAYSREYLDFNLPPREYSYDLSKFIGNDDVTKPFKNIPEVVSWKVLSTTFSRSVTKETFTMTFDPKGEAEGMSQANVNFDNFNFKNLGLSLDKIKIQMTISDSNSKKGESKVSFTLEDGKASLNYIKLECRIVNNVLEKSEVGEGWKEAKV